MIRFQHCRSFEYVSFIQQKSQKGLQTYIFRICENVNLVRNSELFTLISQHSFVYNFQNTTNSDSSVKDEECVVRGP